MRLLLFFLLPVYLFGAQILSYNIYERTDRADVMITFDTPYNGKLKLSKGESKIILKLENATIESTKIKKVNSKYLKSIAITPLKSYVQIVAITPSNVKLYASKTADAYGLRLRFATHSTAKHTKAPSAQHTQTSLANLPTKKGDDLSTSYYIVVGILIIGIAILFYIKKKITPKHPQQKQQSQWLFNQQQSIQQPVQQPQQPQPQQPTQTSNEISIRFQKQLDSNNSVVMLDFLNQSYLLLIGNGNILLDKFLDNKPTTQAQFDAILQERQNELEDFLANPPTPSSAQTTAELQEPLQAYKERAATLAYGES